MPHCIRPCLVQPPSDRPGTPIVPGQNLSTFTAEQHKSLPKFSCSYFCAEPLALAISGSEYPLFLQNYLLLRMLSLASRTVQFHIATGRLSHSITVAVSPRSKLRFGRYRGVSMSLRCRQTIISDHCDDTGRFGTNDGTSNQKLNLCRLARQS